MINNLKHNYSEDIHAHKISLVGPLPRAIGGVSVHVQRVVQKYKRQGNIVRCCDFSKIRWYRFIFWDCWKWLVSIFYFRPTIINFHGLYSRRQLFEIAILIFFKFFCKYQLVVINHNCRYWQSRGVISKWFFNIIAKYIDKQVLIGSSTFDNYQKNGIKCTSISVESPFIPVDECGEVTLSGNYPDSLLDFITKQSPLIVINGSDLTYNSGKDLYGFATALDLLNVLKSDFPQAGLLIVLGKCTNQEYYRELQGKIKSYDLQDNVYFLINNYQLWPLLKRADLFLRPTLWDSYGMSIAEALQFGVPAIASDVCSRPEGAIIYQLGNNQELFLKAHACLKNKQLFRREVLIE